MKVNKFLEIFKDLDPETDISIPDLNISGYNMSDIPKICKVDLSLELFKIKDRQYSLRLEKVLKNRKWYRIGIGILIVICILLAGNKP